MEKYKRHIKGQYELHILLSDYIIRDSQNDNKKCGEANSSHRLFRLNGKDANKKSCQVKCGKDENCVAFSGVWNEWCIGCNVIKFTTKQQGAIAFKKVKGIYSKYLYSIFFFIFRINLFT